MPRIPRLARGLAAAMIAIGVSAAPAAARASEPTTTAATQEPVEVLHAALRNSMRLSPDATCESVISILRPAVQQTFDLAAIARQVLRPHWETLDPAQQKTVIELLGENIVLQYAQHFGPGTKVGFQTGAASALGTQRARVPAELIRTDAEPVHLLYVVQADDAGIWHIVNVFADGVSDLALRRTQYDKQIADSGLESLLRWLQQNNESALRECPPHHSMQRH